MYSTFRRLYRSGLFSLTKGLSIMTNLEKAQDFTLGQCLSDWPDGATYDEVCELISSDARDDETDEPLVTVWEPFEYADVLHIMDNMVNAVTRLLDSNN